MGLESCGDGSETTKINPAEGGLTALSSDVQETNGGARDFLQMGNVFALEGDFNSAIEAYSRAIRIRPDYVEALVNIGTCYKKQGRLALAIDSIRTALATKPDFAPGYYSLGNVYLACNDKQRATETLLKALALAPDLVPALWKLALTYQQEGQLQKAVNLYRRIIYLNGSSTDVLLNLGNAQVKLGDTCSAMRSFMSVLELDPDHRDACRNLALVLEEQGQYAEALEMFRHALSLDQSSPDLWYRVATLLRRENKNECAISYLKKCLELQPNHPQALYDLVDVYSDLGSMDDAVGYCQMRFQDNPEDASVLTALGKSLRNKGCFDRAAREFKSALRIDPEHLPALCLAAATCIELGEVDSGIRYFRRATAVQPGDPKIRCDLGLALLLQENYSEGWRYYESRLEIKKDCPPQKAETTANRIQVSRKRRWRHLLLVREQGLGDEVMFYSMLNDAKRLACRITVSADKRLLPVLRRSFPEITFISASEVSERADYDMELQIGSLGQYVRRSKQDFLSAQEPYLIADCAKSTAIRECLGLAMNSKRRLVCGLSWKSANPDMGSDKSIRLQELASILSNPDIMFVSLQYGDVGHEIASYRAAEGVRIEMVNEIDNMTDLDGLTALINACDMVITISNTTAHIAGALGVPTCLLVRKRADWRWGVSGSSTRWYRSLRIFRQETESDWQAPVGQLKKELACIRQFLV